jgi:hypothetical protein
LESKAAKGIPVKMTDAPITQQQQQHPLRYGMNGMMNQP